MRRSQGLLKTPHIMQSRRLASSNANSGGFAKVVAIAVGTTAVGAAGVAGYASYDSDFRKQVELAVPGTKDIFNFAIGVPEAAAPRLKDLRPLQFFEVKDPKILPKPFEAKSSTKPDKSIAVSNPEESSKKVELKKELIGVKESSPTSSIVVANNETKTMNKTPPATVEKPKKVPNPYVGVESSLDKNEVLTEQLKAKLLDAEKSTRAATSAKLETIRAIENHIQKIREAIEDGKDGDWDAVTVAHMKAKRNTEKDIEAEKNARNMIAELVIEANLGSQSQATQLNPLLPISKATATKLSNELDEMASNVKTVDSERIFTRDYGKLVNESRKKFMLELKAIHPELDYEEGKKLKGSDLRTILAHAHLRVDQLSMKLIHMKMNETKLVNEQVEKKKAELLEKLRIEAEQNAKKNNVKIVETIVKVPEIDQKKFEEELAKKIKEVQERYDERLEQVVRTQKQLYDIEHAQDIENAVGKERNIHKDVIEKALAQLEGIEKALLGHLQMDIENRRSKQVWLASQNLVDTVKFGNRGSCCMEGRRAPLGDQMNTLMKCGGDDHFLKLLDSSMKRVSKVKGEYTCADLNTRFQKVCRIGRRIAYVNETSGNGVMAHLFSWLKSSVTISLPIKKGDDMIKPSGETNISILARAENLWQQGKRRDAIRVLQLTKGATRRLASDFIEDARRHEESLLLTRLLLAHSALTSIRSTY